MCGPSGAMKNLNNTVQQFTNQVTSEAGSIFGAANTVFNNIMNATQGIVTGGPSQAGYSTEELNAMNAANVQTAGTVARNLKGAAASSGAAIGGGNAVTPAGSTQAAVENAETQAAETQAAGENAIVQQDYATGNQNFFKALGTEESAPSVFQAADSANQVAGNQQQNAEKSQQNIDSQNNWWKNDIMKLGTAAAGGLTGGFSSALGQGWANDITGNSSPSVPLSTAVGSIQPSPVYNPAPAGNNFSTGS